MKWIAVAFVVLGLLCYPSQLLSVGGQALIICLALVFIARPVAVLLTHHHPDHIGGVQRIRARWPVLCAAPHDPRIALDDGAPGTVVRVAEGDTVRIDALGLELQVLEVPGHTRTHVAYYARSAGDAAGMLFCGDTLFSLGCGRLFEGTPQQMLASLERLAQLARADRCLHRTLIGRDCAEFTGECRALLSEGLLECQFQSGNSLRGGFTAHDPVPQVAESLRQIVAQSQQVGVLQLELVQPVRLTGRGEHESAPPSLGRVERLRPKEAAW